MSFFSDPLGSVQSAASDPLGAVRQAGADIGLTSEQLGLSDLAAQAESAGRTLSGQDAAEAAVQAAETQAAAAQSGVEETARQFDITQENLAPFLQAGVSALGQQQALLGLGTPEEQAAAMAAFQESPGQQYLRNQQERALLRNAAAIGGLGGGNIRTALQEQAANRAATDFGNQFNRLASLSGGGQTTGTNLGQFGSQNAATQANLLGQAGAAQAAGTLGAAQARASGLQNLIGLGTLIAGA